LGIGKPCLILRMMSRREIFRIKKGRFSNTGLVKKRLIRSHYEGKKSENIKPHINR